jgi:hypothetical protein
MLVGQEQDQLLLHANLMQYLQREEKIVSLVQKLPQAAIAEDAVVEILDKTM